MFPYPHESNNHQTHPHQHISPVGYNQSQNQRFQMSPDPTPVFVEPNNQPFHFRPVTVDNLVPRHHFYQETPDDHGRQFQFQSQQYNRPPDYYQQRPRKTFDLTVDTKPPHEVFSQPRNNISPLTHRQDIMSPVNVRPVFSPIGLTSMSPVNHPVRFSRTPSATSEIYVSPMTHSLFSPINVGGKGDRPRSVPMSYGAPELVPPVEPVDVKVTKNYNGKREFASFEEAIEALTRWAEENAVILRKGSGNNKTMKDGSKKKVVLVCQCSGKYRSCSGSPSADDGQKPVRKRRSKKTECPFRINLNYRAKSNTWNITKMTLEHNHP
ncbi:FAR1 domain-containing protein [Entamoeba marina]